MTLKVRGLPSPPSALRSTCAARRFPPVASNFLLLLPQKKTPQLHRRLDRMMLDECGERGRVPHPRARQDRAMFLLRLQAVVRPAHEETDVAFDIGIEAGDEIQKPWPRASLVELFVETAVDVAPTVD